MFLAQDTILLPAQCSFEHFKYPEFAFFKTGIVGYQRKKRTPELTLG